MKKEMVVAVIDSGVDKSDKLLAGQEIQEVYYNKEYESNDTNKKNIHGTEIIKVLLREAANVNIISIQALNEDNKCTLSLIIDAIEYCIELGVDVINLSLGGCSHNLKRINDLQDVCNKAFAKGIAIFAADNNIPNLKSYPANFENVISVSTPDDLSCYCQIIYNERTIKFSDNYVFIPHERKCIIRKGNSYLCPIIVGLFCRFIKSEGINDNRICAFMDFMEDFCSQDTISKIFVDKKSDSEMNDMTGKRISYFADEMCFNNRNLFEFYSTNNQVSWSIKEIMNLSKEDIALYFADVDIFFIGVLSNKFLEKHGQFLHELIHELVTRKVAIITVLPILNTYDRILLTRHNTFLKSMYK